jgi:5'-3' exonuclease
MYGLDADLFMLSLGTHAENFYLLREDQFTNSCFYIVSITKFREKLYQKMGNSDLHINQSIDNFILSCFLVGNDFLHALPAFHQLEESIELITTLISTNKLNISNLDSQDLTINKHELLKLFELLSPFESELIKTQPKKFPNFTLNNSFVDNVFSFELYRKLYYKKVGDGKSMDESDIMTMCRRYIQGLDWVNYYYHNKPKNWTWIYPYHFSPLICDLVTFLKSEVPIKPMHSIVKNPLLPFQQLLCVLPPKSKELVPYRYRHIYTELPEYYPTIFELDLEGKTQDWQSVAILPFINLEKILEKYSECGNVNCEMNKIGKNIIF